MLDRHLFARQTHAGSDSTLRDREWEKRKTTFLKTLCEQFPLNRLRSSEIEFDYETKDGKVFISAYLSRSRQSLLDLRSGLQKLHDPYALDIAMVEEARPGIREKYETALKGDADPFADPDLAEHRRQLWNAWKVNRGPTLTIYSTVDGEEISLKNMDRFLPHARLARVVFRVDRISRRSCRIRVSSLMLMNDHRDDVSADFQIPNRPLEFVRDQRALGEQAGQLLAQAMETQLSLQSIVRLEFSWVDGSLARWTLCELPTKALLDASNSSTWRKDAIDTSEPAASSFPAASFECMEGVSTRISR